MSFADDDGKNLAGEVGVTVEDHDLIVLSAGGKLDLASGARGLFGGRLIGFSVAIELARLYGASQDGAEFDRTALVRVARGGLRVGLGAGNDGFTVVAVGPAGGAFNENFDRLSDELMVKDIRDVILKS